MNEELEVFSLTEEIERFDSDSSSTPNNHNNLSPKRKKIKIGLMILIILGVAASSYLAYSFLVKIIKNNETPNYSNVIGKENIIETSLDLPGIFIYSKASSIVSTDTQVRAVFTKDKIFYDYSPFYCLNRTARVATLCQNLDVNIRNCEETKSTICSNSEYSDLNDMCNKENYCEETYTQSCEAAKKQEEEFSKGLCSSYKEDDFDGLNIRLIISSNLDGSNYKEHKKIEPSDRYISFDYVDKDHTYVYSDGDIFKINNNTSEFGLLAKNKQIAPYPLSNDDSIVLIGGEEYKYDLYKYDPSSKKETPYFSFYSSTNDSAKIIMDPYIKGDYYTTASGYSDKSIDEKSYGLYKNGELVYEFKNVYFVQEVIPTREFIYVILKDNSNDDSYNLVKLNKQNYTLIEKKENILKRENESRTNYLMTNSDNQVFIQGLKGIYHFNQEKEEIEMIEDSTLTLLTASTYHNYILYYDKIDDNSYKDLVIYNTITKEKTIINDCAYYYINRYESRLYIVKYDENTSSLSYYDID